MVWRWALLFRRCPLRPYRQAASHGALDITCWVGIAPDNTVTIQVAHSEMGQGAMTGLAMLVAEELECDWTAVKTEFVSPDGKSAKKSALGRHFHRGEPFNCVLASTICAAPARPRGKC